MTTRNKPEWLLNPNPPAWGLEEVRTASITVAFDDPEGYLCLAAILKELLRPKREWTAIRDLIRARRKQVPELHRYSYTRLEDRIGSLFVQQRSKRKAPFLRHTVGVEPIRAAIPQSAQRLHPFDDAGHTVTARRDDAPASCGVERGSQ